MLFLFLVLHTFADQFVYRFYDDGGETGYLEKCETYSESHSLYSSSKKKLKGANTKAHFLGSVSESGELLTFTDYFYSDKDACNQGLKKARAWFDKEYSAKPKSLKPEELINKDKHSLYGAVYTVEFYGTPEFCKYDAISILRQDQRVFELKNLCGREIPRKGTQVLSSRNFSQIVKLGSKETDVYLRIFEEPANNLFKTTLISLSSKPSVAATIGEQGKFEDFDQDGLVDFLKPGGEGEPTGKTRSYDPYLVYRQTKENVSFVFDEKLSRRYSEQNKFEWHGPKYDEAIQVDKNGKALSKSK